MNQNGPHLHGDPDRRKYTAICEAKDNFLLANTLIASDMLTCEANNLVVSFKLLFASVPSKGCGEGQASARGFRQGGKVQLLFPIIH